MTKTSLMFFNQWFRKSEMCFIWAFYSSLYIFIWISPGNVCLFTCALLHTYKYLHKHSQHIVFVLPTYCVYTLGLFLYKISHVILPDLKRDYFNEPIYIMNWNNWRCAAPISLKDMTIETSRRRVYMLTHCSWRVASWISIKNSRCVTAKHLSSY